MAKQAGKDLEADLLIVGGGMIGLTVARAVAGAGLTSIVVDREAPAAALAAAADGRASALAAGSVRLLRDIGVWQGMEPEAQAILEIRVSDGDSPLFLHYDHKSIGDEPFGFMVENRVTRQALHDAIASTPEATHLAPGEVASLERGVAGVTARLGDGRAVRARLAIAADGRGSATRARAGITVQRLDYRQTAIVCTVEHERPHRGIAQERFLAAGPFAILPLPGNRSSLVWTEREDLAPTLMALDDDAFAAELAWRFTDFLGQVRPIGQRWSYPLALTWASRMTDRRLALIGDAARAIHPIAGQGLNLGLRDVGVLAEVLGEAAALGLDPGAASSLATYARRRRFDVLSMSLVTDGINRLFSNDVAPLRLGRDLGLAAVDKIPPLKRVFMRHAMGLLPI
ncbi:MAG: UbiH/UbiF/VisC/COQ6 family ubiquinone biosynthesis hydroxylase [Alphaproteobacteria bacterium]|jgi:2-octaprenyl-6-methoxyphenol hydroxylase|nr:UbiH/UbiF/VisC/COQ6 family ubiquinone biosynthesis hydroxylase [Alphaproteobacteria bacterium]